MRPRLFEIHIPFLDWTLPVNSYGTMMVVGFLLAVYLAGRRAKRLGLDPNVMTDMGMVAIISGILGARLFYVIEFFKDFNGNVIEMLRVDKGGLVFYGGFFTAVVCVAIYARKKKLSMLDILDISTPSVAVGLAFTRIGCFLNGCCWGKICSPALPWAIRYPHESEAFTSQLASKLVGEMDRYSRPIHPTQLYESFAAFGLFILTSWLFRYRKRKGDILAAFAASYSVVRFVIEFFRADNELLSDGLTVSQNISIVVFVAAVGWLVWGALRGGIPAESK
jgi:phosphatidylglycerol:prolipoprotein diacylglycerol transferase